MPRLAALCKKNIAKFSAKNLTVATHIYQCPLSGQARRQARCSIFRPGAAAKRVAQSSSQVRPPGAALNLQARCSRQARRSIFKPGAAARRGAQPSGQTRRASARPLNEQRRGKGIAQEKQYVTKEKQRPYKKGTGSLPHENRFFYKTRKGT